MRFLITFSLLLLTCFARAAAQNVAGVDPVDTARRTFQEEKFDAALATLEEAEKRGLRSGKLLHLRGAIFLEQGKFDGAIQSFEAARENEPASFGRLAVGDALRRQQKWEDARAAFQAGMKESNVLITNERLRYGVFITYLGAKDEERAQRALEQLIFPTETPAYYYGQAAWAFAHGEKRAARKWLDRAEEIFPAKATAWFARPLYDFGWLKTKPPLVAD